jgi:type IV pilus assembly protein PilC
MMIMVVPQVKNLYEDMGQELPGLTQFLVNISDFFGNFWWLVMLVVAAIAAGIWYAVKKTPVGRRVADSFKIHVPIFGALFRKLYVSRFARTAEMMLATGVPMLDSVQIAIDATNNTIIEEEYSKSLEVIKGGKPLSEALKDRDYMLPLVPQMASIGEESGTLDTILQKAADYFEDEADAATAKMVSALEPVMIIIMAIIVGVVVGGIAMPIFTMAQWII